MVCAQSTLCNDVSMIKKRTSNEFFDPETGSDEWLHAELLDNPEADLNCRIQSAKHMMANGRSELSVRKLYMLPSDIDLNA